MFLLWHRDAMQPGALRPPPLARCLWQAAMQPGALRPLSRALVLDACDERQFSPGHCDPFPGHSSVDDVRAACLLRKTWAKTTRHDDEAFHKVGLEVLSSPWWKTWIAESFDGRVDASIASNGVGINCMLLLLLLAEQHRIETTSKDHKWMLRLGAFIIMFYSGVRVGH